MKDFFAASPVAAWGLVGVMLALVAISVLWTRLQWWWHNTWYSFPLIGKISSLSGDTNRDSTDSSWFKAERTLCRDYKKFIRIQDEHDFNEKVTYLTKAGDNGRRETPGLIWLLTIALVFIEAMGFSYVLAGYTLPGASENMQQMGAYGIAFLISVILVAFTHFAGHELSKSGKIKAARQEWSEGGRKGKITTGTVPLARQQSTDDDQPGYVHLMNRVGTMPSYYASIGTAIFVAIVAIGATYVRGQVLEKQLHQQTVGQSVGGNETQGRAADGLDMSRGSAIKLPSADAAENRLANDKAVADDVSIDRHGGWGTFIVLAFIFVFLQILGVFFGFRWGFVGKDSPAAFRAIGGGRYSSYADVREHYKDIADTAQSKLEHLQQKLMNRNSISGTDGLHTTKSFYDFMDTERSRETDERAKELKHSRMRGEMEKLQPASPASTPVAAAAAAPAPAPAPAPVAAPAPVPTPTFAPIEPAAGESPLGDLSATLQHLTRLGSDKEAKRTFINGLPEVLKAQVMQALKTQKDDAARLSRERDAELDSLLD